MNTPRAQAYLPRPTVQTGAWPQAHPLGGAVEDFLHDSIAVLLSTGEAEHDVEPVGF